MSNWMIIPEDSDLIHGLGGHKYIDRIWKNGKWKYIYYDAKKGARNLKNRAAKGLRGIQREAGNIIGTNQKAQLQRSQEAARRANQRGDQRRAMELNKRSQENKKNYDNTLLGRLDQLKNKGAAAYNKLKTAVAPNKEFHNTVTNRGSVTKNGYSNVNNGNRITSYTPSYTKNTHITNKSDSKRQYSPSYTTERDKNRPNNGKSSSGRKTASKKKTASVYKRR